MGTPRLGVQMPRWLLQPPPLFPPSPLPAKVTPPAMQPRGAEGPLPPPQHMPAVAGAAGGWRCSCWAWQGLGVPCGGGDGRASLRRVATLVLAPSGGEGPWAWGVEAGWDLETEPGELDASSAGWWGCRPPLLSPL